MLKRLSNNEDLECINLGMEKAVAYYTNVDEEYAALRKSAGLIDLTFTKRVMVKGDNATEFLQNLVTKDLYFASEEQTITCLMLREDGTIIGEAIIYVRQNDYILEIWPDVFDEMNRHMKSYLIDGVEMEDITNSTDMILLEGPYAWEIVKNFISFPIEILPYGNYATFKYAEGDEEDIILARLGYTAEFGYKIMGSKEAVQAIMTKIEDVMTKHEMKQVGLNALNIARLEVRFPDFTKETDETKLAVESGANFYMDSNSDFVGKSPNVDLIKGRMDEQIVCIQSVDGEVHAEDSLLVEDEKIGYIKHVEYSPQQNRKIGIAYIDKRFAAAGLVFGSSDGQVKTVSSPMINTKSMSTRIG